jgi:hypothetical protein
MQEYLDTLAKVLGGGLSAIAGGWATGILARRRVLQRNVRAIEQEVTLIEAAAHESNPLIQTDVQVATQGKHVSQTIRRFPVSALTAASTSGAFDHLQKSELPEKVRALLAAATAANEAIGHREMMLASTGIYQTDSRAHVSRRILTLIADVESASVEVRTAIRALSHADGGKRLFGV